MPDEPAWRRYLRFTRPDPAADVDDEIGFHLQELERRYLAQGLPPEAARRAARDQFGDATSLRASLTGRTRQRYRQAERTEWWRRRREDTRLALRRLRRQPGFALVAILTLALGTGATTAVFSVVNTTLLRPLPYPGPDRLVQLTTLYQGRPFAVSVPDFVDWQAQAQSFRAMAAWNAYSRTLTSEGDPLPLPSAIVTGDFFEVMGVRPTLGRTFAPEELVYGQTDAAIISDGLWRTAFGSRPDIIGHSIQLEGRTRTIVGVMPAGFSYPEGARIWTPWAFSQDDLTTQRGAHYLQVISRLKDGIEPAAAITEIATISARLAREYPATNSEYTGTGMPLRDALVGDTSRRALVVLMFAVTLVTLIACVNVANLLMARGEHRRRELAVRASLGARPRDLLMAALTESVALAVLGGAAGIGLAWVATRALAAFQPDELLALGTADIDLVVLAFTMGLSLVTGLLFGLMPAVQAGRAGSAHGTLRAEGRGSSMTREGWRARSMLVASELTLAVVLLSGAGLLIRSFVRLSSVDPGFTTQGLLTFRLSLPDARYPSEEASRQFIAQLRERVNAIPGVTAVEATTGLPLDGHGFSMSTSFLDGVHIEDEKQPSTQVRIVTAGLLDAMAIRVVRGRGFSATDRAGSPGVVLLSESAARLLFPGMDAVGHTLAISTGFGFGRGRAGGEVVGIVEDIRDQALGIAPRPMSYLLHAQWPVTNLSLVVRSPNPGSLVAPVREALRGIDPLLPMVAVRTMDRVASESVAQPRFVLLLLGSFAAIALALASIGVFGVISYVVGQRTREIGVRLALGARGGTVVTETVRRAMAPVAAGLGLGLLAARILSQAAAGLLYETSPTDPATLATVVVILGGAATLAAWIPARRASRVDPVSALRAE